MAAALVDMGRVALDVVLAVGPMVSSEHVAKTQHVMQMRHSRLESFREDVRDLLDERLDSSQNLTLKSTLLFGFVTAILVEGFPPQKMKSEMCVDVFLFLVPWGICLLFQSMTFAVLYQRGMMTVGHRHLRELQRIGSKQAEEEIAQGPQTFADNLQSRWRARNRRREEVATEWRLTSAGRAVWGLVARLFALPPGPPGFKQPSCSQCNSDEEKEEFCSLNGSDGEDLEHHPSDGVLSLDYLTLELKGRRSSKSPLKDVSSQVVDRSQAEPKEEQLHRPKELVHVTELSKMPEVKALELYEGQAYDTVFGGSLFTLMSLGFCVVYHIQLRLEVYEDHPMAFFARLGIFLPPFMVAAFTIFIRPYPEKPHYRAMVEDMEDYRNPSRVRPATQCVVLFGALISCTSLAFALQLHAPPVLATPQKRPVLRVTEWTVDRWPLFFHPKGLTASEDALIVTTDFAVARFQLHDRVAQLAEERRLRGYELGDATVMNSSILLAGQRELYYLKSFGTDEASDLTGLGLPSAVGGGTEVPRGLAFWPQQNLLFLAPPRGGIVASRMADLNHSLGIDFRLPMQEAVFGLSVDQDEDLLYVLLQQELRVFDLGDRPGSLLRSFRLPQEENNTWSGLACVGRRLFAVMHSPAKLLHLQLPGRQCSLRNCQEMMS